jgi:hypothetical protein
MSHSSYRRLAPSPSIASITALAILPVSLGASGCTCGHGVSRAEAARDFGQVEAPAPDADACAAYLAIARAVLQHDPAPGDAAPPSAGPGRRVVLALYDPPLEPVVVSSLGTTTVAAVTAAAEVIAARIPARAAVAGGRLELDIPTRLADATLEEDMAEPVGAIGLDGVLVITDGGAAGAILPGEIVQRGLFHEGRAAGLTHGKLATLLATRAGVGPSDVPKMRAYRFGADAHVESASHDRALPLMRGMVERTAPAQVTVEHLLAAVRHGADYLLRVLDAQGRYVYLYRPVEDRDDASYGWLRHAGTTYALFEAYEELGVPAYLEKGELALKYLAAHLVDDPESNGKYALDTRDEEQQKVGGAGLALLAFAKHAAVTGKRDDLETMRALARLIVKEQYADGHFHSNADVEHDTGKKLKREPVYYPGEAVLGLMRLYALDPQPSYLDAARRGADWVIHVRDEYVSVDNQEHDHWMAYAANELYRVTHDEAYLEHGAKIARAIQKRQQTSADAPAPDLVGTFFDGQTTPGSTRLEAYDAVIAMSRFAHKPDAWLLDLALPVASATLGQQYDPDNDYWLKNPTKAVGGVRESLFVQDVRIDYVQHAMSAWLHLARSMRDPAYGQTGAPSQDPLR